MPASRYYSRSLIDGRSFSICSSEQPRRNRTLPVHRQASFASSSRLLSSNSCHYNVLSCRWISRTAKKTTYYDTLGINQTASAKDIKSAYYEQSKKWHPDVNPSAEASTKFREVSEAYETLGSERSRKSYDEKLDATSFSRTGYARPNSTTYRETNMPGHDPSASGFNRRTGHRKAPQSGKDQYWDYDEYYRQHYAYVRERQYREAQWRQYQEEFRSQQMARGVGRMSQRGENTKLFIFLCIIATMLIFLDLVETEPNPYTMQAIHEKQRKAREEYVLRDRMRKGVSQSLSDIFPADDSFTGHNVPNNPYRPITVTRVVMSEPPPTAS